MKNNRLRIRLFAPLLAGALFFFAPAAGVRSADPAAQSSEKTAAVLSSEGERDEVPVVGKAGFMTAGKAIGLLPEQTAAGKTGAARNGRIPRGVTVDGVPVGGMTKKKAKEFLRKLREPLPTLTVHTPAGDYCFSRPQIGFSDNLDELLSAAVRGGKYQAEIRYFLNGPETQAEYICANNALSALDAEVVFSREGFSYEESRAGIVCDKERLKKEIAESLAAGPVSDGEGGARFSDVTLHTRTQKPAKTLADAKRGTQKISAFSTFFNSGDKGRTGNISLAASRIDGRTILPGEEFSFNAVVGERTKANGFGEAKVIKDGEFIVGVGGGVCQVSTTLYNAAVLAGLKITARKPHSLAVHYVEPSRDAMVSSVTDFRFRNTHSYPVYLSLKVKGEQITATFYGVDEGYRYEIVSVTTGEIPPPDPIEKKGDYEGVIREGKPGIRSEAYLETYRYGKLLKREKLRTDSYAPVRGIVGVLREKAALPQNQEN